MLVDSACLTTPRERQLGSDDTTSVSARTCHHLVQHLRPAIVRLPQLVCAQVLKLAAAPAIRCGMAHCPAPRRAGLSLHYKTAVPQHKVDAAGVVALLQHDKLRVKAASHAAGQVLAQHCMLRARYYAACRRQRQVATAESVWLFAELGAMHRACLHIRLGPEACDALQVASPLAL